MREKFQFGQYQRKSVFVLLAVLLSAGGFSQTALTQVLDEPEWYLPTGDGCGLYVREIGEAKPIAIVVHGGFGAEHSYLFDPLSELRSRYHLAFYDQRGSLRSPCPVDQISVDKHVEDLERLRNELGAAKVTLIGHSRGAYLAMAYLQKYPDRVTGLVLLGPASLKKPTNPKDQSSA